MSHSFDGFGWPVKVCILCDKVSLVQQRPSKSFLDPYVVTVQDPDSIAPEEEKEAGEIKKVERSAAPMIASPNQAPEPHQTLPKLEDILRPRVIRSPSASGNDSPDESSDDSAGISDRHRCLFLPWDNTSLPPLITRSLMRCPKQNLTEKRRQISCLYVCAKRVAWHRDCPLPLNAFAKFDQKY